MLRRVFKSSRDEARNTTWFIQPISSIASDGAKHRSFVVVKGLNRSIPLHVPIRPYLSLYYYGDGDALCIVREERDSHALAL